MKLIPNWKRSLRMYSMCAMAVATATQATWVALPANWQASVPQSWVTIITLAALVAGIAGRLIEQPSVSGAAPGEPGKGAS